MANAKIYRTSSTALAAYLISEGFPMVLLSFDENKALFTFEDGNPLDEHIRNFELLQAIGNIPVFYNTYRSLLKQIHLFKRNDNG